MSRARPALLNSPSGLLAGRLFFVIAAPQSSLNFSAIFLQFLPFMFAVDALFKYIHGIVFPGFDPWL